jgi:hypothetical protein
MDRNLLRSSAMKRITKRLQFSNETVRVLVGDQLQQVQGGELANDIGDREIYGGLAYLPRRTAANVATGCNSGEKSVEYC